MKILYESNLDTNRPEFNLIPNIKLWYTNSFFLETGVYTPAIVFETSWFKIRYSLLLQKEY
jgi:hypothetical protein